MDLSREEILDIIRQQNPKYIRHIERIEYVFKYKMNHLTWDDGSPITERPLTKEELILLVDPPFIYSKEMAKMGYNEEQQRQIHMASDPLLWAQEMLNFKSRAYQTLVLRNPHDRKVMRWGRRLGKTISLTVFILWYAYTNPKARIIIVTPVMAQAQIIYDGILEMAEKSEVVYGSIQRKVRTPHLQIELFNKSTIKLFSTGIKSGNKSDTIRGQEADVLVLDEMDYMGPDDLVALMAMLQTTDEDKTTEKMLLAASTPTGQRSTFWQWNTNPKSNFVSFWFPSYVNPGWNQQIEDQFRIDYPDIFGYTHEVEAAWGESAEGVYPRKAIDGSFIDFWEEEQLYSDGRRKTWKYELYNSNPQSTYVFGVDWDKYGAGVNVVVLELCHSNYPNSNLEGKIRLVYREEIMKGEFTYVYSVQRIAELAAIYMPKHIYVDRGAGETQLELLHLYGKENPHTMLHKTVKGWQFSQSIEVTDPFTKELIKKELKLFMVDNLFKMLEKDQLRFSMDDDEMYMELISYIRVRESITGKPIFGMSGDVKDHAHDALLLACFAIADNYDELLNPVYASFSIPISNSNFLPTFELTNKQDEELAKEIYEDKPAPVMLKRPMAGFSMRRNSSGMSIQRKMF